MAVLAHVQVKANVRNRYMLWHILTEYLTIVFLFKTHLHLFYSLFHRKSHNQIRIHSLIPKKNLSGIDAASRITNISASRETEIAASRITKMTANGITKTTNLSVFAP